MELNWRVQNCVLMTVTPMVATAWLTNHNKFNRDIKPSVVEQYRRDIRSGRWSITHQGIAFDWNGQLIDGQHRLTAISQETAVQVYVTTGLDPLTRASVDTHSKRNTADAFTLSGRQLKHGTVAANSAAGMWSRMMWGLTRTKGKETRQELLAFENRYRDGGTWTLEEFGKYPRYRYVQIAPVMAAVARSYYHVDHGRLAQFIEALSTGVMRTPDDVTAIHFRNVLSSTRLRGNSNVSAEIYGKTTKAIQSFIRRDSLTKFYQPAEEPFPLPDAPDPGTTQESHRMAGSGGRLFTGAPASSVLVAEARG